MLHDVNDAILHDGELVQHSWKWGYVVLSYLVSLTGTWTALELLHKRTSTRGLYNWYLLIGAAVAMGAVAIWSMHFIGNRAINMSDGRSLQLAYNPGFTAASFFLPIICVGVAFYVFGITENVSKLGTLAGGICTGSAVCGMHYLGQLGITNYTPVYNHKFVAGSVIIAIVASTLALGVFFYLRSRWTNSWWKRVICAMVLASTVSGMHWVATGGTHYRITMATIYYSNDLSKHTTVVVTLCLALGCCLTLLLFAVIGQRSRKRSADRAQQVVLACAIFDPEGRLMVSPEGLLPCQKITNSYVERSFDDVFGIEHPVFCWIFRASRCWQGITDLIPGMRHHLRITNLVKATRPLPCVEVDRSDRNSIEHVEDYSLIFKESFCVAASDLAATMQEPIENIGVLYEDIMSTGTVRKNIKAKMFSKSRKLSRGNDVEKGMGFVTFGRGQLLFTVRRTNKLESTRLQAAGFRFASATVPNVLQNLARSMEVTPDELAPRLDRMREYAEKDQIYEPGVHLSCFVLRPLFQKGFHVLVQKDAKSLLPAVPLPIRQLEGWHVHFLAHMDNLTVTDCREWLRGRSHHLATEREKQFSLQLLNAITELESQIRDQCFKEARLVARPFQAPCRNPNDSQAPEMADMIAFRTFADVHEYQSNDGVQFAPFRFFASQQRAYKGSPNNEVFVRTIHREFLGILRSDDTKALSSAPDGRNSSVCSENHSCAPLRRLPTHRVPSPTGSRGRWGFPGCSPCQEQISGDGSSEKILSQTEVDQGLGGILNSNNISIDVSEVQQDDTNADVELSNLNLSPSREARDATVEQETFIDVLLALTLNERRALEFNTYWESQQP